MLSEKQQVVLEALLAGDTTVAAAVKGKVSHQLVSRWKKLPEFKTALTAQRDDIQASILEDITTQLIPLLTPAVKAVKLCLETGNGAVRMRAADLVLTKLAEAGKALEVVAEMEQLKAELADARSQNTTSQDPPRDQATQGPDPSEPRQVPRPYSPDDDGGDTGRSLAS